jgi:hypothetical protein
MTYLPLDLLKRFDALYNDKNIHQSYFDIDCEFHKVMFDIINKGIEAGRYHAKDGKILDAEAYMLRLPSWFRQRDIVKLFEICLIRMELKSQGKNPDKISFKDRVFNNDAPYKRMKELTDSLGTQGKEVYINKTYATYPEEYDASNTYVEFKDNRRKKELEQKHAIEAEKQRIEQRHKDAVQNRIDRHLAKVRNNPQKTENSNNKPMTL